LYLESLEIHGFKSFGKKTKFKFTDGITSIVGPNGCGKSNVVDALRWVLGEQKAGTIRSERMENVIFNGSKTIKPLGMAEVSIAIQNTRNVLPIEYSEVVITRRLFRSGESQYLINHSPCRLKDILDLFMDTGLGPDAYSIMELSMVESIINGKPEDRRRIFEEAAGVTKYKVRRKAALRKLEATAADILRLNDILSEVEKNVNSLQRQVKRAQRYQELKETLKGKEVQFATHEFSKIKNELEPLFARLNTTQDKRAELTSQFDEKEAQIEQARLTLLETERRLSAQQRLLNELTARIQKIEEEILVDRERRKALEEAKVRLHRDKEEAAARIEKTEIEIAQLKENLQGLFEKIQAAESDFQEKNVNLKSMEVNVQDKRDRLKGIEKQRLLTADSLAKSKQEEERIRTQLENIDARMTSINRELEEAALLERIRQEKIDKLNDQRADLTSHLQQMRSAQLALQKQMQNVGAEKENLKEEIFNRRSELQTLKERIELLKKFIESYEDHPEGVQHLLLQGYLNGNCKGTLAENLTVDSRYRRAIETALGDAAVSLIVEETDQALQCIEILKSSEKGTVTFFPLDKFKAHRNGHAARNEEIRSRLHAGVIDWATNLVNCNDDYRHLIESLLCDYLIVSDLETAKAQAPQLGDHRVSLITLNGEIISTWGMIKGGAQGEAGVVGRKALVDELESKARNLFVELENEERRHHGFENQYQDCFNRDQDLSKQIKTKEAEITDTEVQLAQLHFESKKDAEAGARFKKEVQEQAVAQDDLKQKIATIAPSLENVEASRGKFNVEFQQISEELLQTELQLEEYRAVVQDSRVKLVDFKSEERHMQEDIGRQQDYLRELRISQQRIANEIVTAETESVELEQRVEQNKAIIATELDERMKLEADVLQLEQYYASEKEKIDAQDKLVKQIRNERDAVSEDLHSIELRVSELKMQAERIKERINEEYKIDLQPQPIDDLLDVATLSEEIAAMKDRIAAMEPVNLLALKEYEKEKERLDFLTTQKNDLITAEDNLKETILVINKTAREQFIAVFEQVQKNFVEVFTGFFANGKASLRLADNEDPLEAEILIEADPKGRRVNALTLLSGGEKALTAISLLFAIYLVKPSPFCILDEVDAPLDDANVGRFVGAIRKFSNNTQFIVVTHNKLTMRSADCLYGVTMEEEGVSKVVSVNFKDMDVGKVTAQAA
jgi:chromosome segregation protein